MSKASPAPAREEYLSPANLGLVIYALLTTSVVLAGADVNDPFEVTYIMIGQALALTLGHGYADSIAHQTTLRAGVVHSLPIAIATLPATFVGVVFGILSKDAEFVVNVAFLTNLFFLVVLQGLATKRVGFTWARLAGAVMLDVVAIVTVVAMIKLLK